MWLRHFALPEAPPTSYTHSPSGVLEQSIVRAKHLVRQQIKPLPSHAPIVQPLLSLELHVESRLECFNVAHFHDEVVRVCKDVTATNWDVQLTRNLVLQGRESIQLQYY